MKQKEEQDERTDEQDKPEPQQEIGSFLDPILTYTPPERAFIVKVSEADPHDMIDELL